MLKSRSQTLPNQINMIEHLILSSVVKLIVQDVRKQPLNSHLWSRFYVQCRESLKDDCNQGSFVFFCGQQNRQKMLLHHLTSSIILWSRNRQKMLSALSVISHRHTNGMKRRMMIMMTWWQSTWHWRWRRDLPKWGDLVWVKHQSVQVLQGGEVGGHCDRVPGQIDVFEVNILKRFVGV